MFIRPLLIVVLLGSFSWGISLSSTSTSSSQTASVIIGANKPSTGVCTPSQTVLCDPFAMAFDSRGDVWVSDGQDNRILEFPVVGGRVSTTASTVIGQANFTAHACGAAPWPGNMRSSNLCFPAGLVFDSHGNLWVADGGGSRIVEYPSIGGAISPQISGLIGPNFTSMPPYAPADGISLPVGLAFDPAGNLWTADLPNSRVLEFPLVNGSIANTPVRQIGQSSMGEGACNQTNVLYNFQNATANDFCLPSDIAFDPSGDLWVTDFGADPSLAGNSRVLEFPYANGTVSATATAVIGQGDFYGFGCNRGLASPANDTLCYPVSLAFDGSGDLWVADSGNSRVLEFPSAAGAISTHAQRVVGQGNFTDNRCNMGGSQPTNYSLCRPLWIGIDQRDNLWVSDTDNLRVLEFPAPATGFTSLQTGLLVGGSAAFLVAVVGVALLVRRRRSKTASSAAEPVTSAPL